MYTYVCLYDRVSVHLFLYMCVDTHMNAMAFIYLIMLQIYIVKISENFIKYLHFLRLYNTRGQGLFSIGLLDLCFVLTELFSIPDRIKIWEFINLTFIDWIYFFFWIQVTTFKFVLIFPILDFFDFIILIQTTMLFRNEYLIIIKKKNVCLVIINIEISFPLMIIRIDTGHIYYYQADNISKRDTGEPYQFFWHSK